MASTCRGKGQTLAVAAAEGSVTVVTSRAYLMRYDLTQGSNPGTTSVLCH